MTDTTAPIDVRKTLERTLVSVGMGTNHPLARKIIDLASSHIDDYEDEAEAAMVTSLLIYASGIIEYCPRNRAFLLINEGIAKTLETILKDQAKQSCPVGKVGLG